MGTDIHGVFQRQDSGKWVDVPSNYEQDRHYQLFAVLADVRNGYGFAGIKTGEPVRPIADPRGYPEDFQVDEDSHVIQTLDIIDPRRRQWHDVADDMAVWMGDHTHSWLTSTEMLKWFQSAPHVIRTGLLTRQEYQQWNHDGAPSSWCGDSWGPNIVKIHDNAIDRETIPNWTHIQCEWESSLAEDLAYFFDEVKRLHEEHGEVRFVFGFDS